MPDAIGTALADALRERYLLERELGRGGMATVYLARDRKLDRLVALKVLHPELQAALGPERFLREIEVCSRLSHPNILPLHDAGEAVGRLFYVMPYVEGESLRQRLQRERQLGVEDTLGIVRAVASALDYAHAAGVIHRDIKPENILLARDPATGSLHPLLADFGLARAVDAAGGERLTETGLALGTPAYMSPEQGAPGERLDGRSDLYGLGCVAYEMLAGAPPFTGPTGQAILARHAVDPVPPLRTVRKRVPGGVEQAIERALAKVPSDRFATAGEFAQALDRKEAAARLHVSRRPVTRWAVSLVLVGSALVLGGVVLERSRSTTAMPPVDAHVIAVVPFRVTARDSTLGYLREGMLDLLSAKLSGTENLRTVDPRTLLSAWRRAGGAPDRDLDRPRALAMARRLGAGRLLEGLATGTGDRIVFNAALTSVLSGQEVQGSVEGRSDSLTRLVDELAAQLLALGAGEFRERLSGLTSTSLPALRAYLDGRAALRRGAYPEAVRKFDRAIELDTTFALAGLGRTQAAIWVNEVYEGTGSLLAWRHRDRLSARDRAFLTFMLGPKYPEPTSASEDILHAESLAVVAPDDPESWCILGDQTYHGGALIGMPDALRRSLHAYRRALSLDSSYLPGWEHLADIHLALGDTAAAMQALRTRLRYDSVSPLAARDRWFGMRVLDDTGSENVSLMNDSLLSIPWDVARTAVEVQTGFEDADSLAKLSLAIDRAKAEGWIRTYYLIRGWPYRARDVVSRTGSPEVAGPLITESLYADGDPAIAESLVVEVARNVQRPSRGDDPAAALLQYAVAQYELSHGRPGAARRLVRAWLRTPLVRHRDPALTIADLMSRLLDTQLATADARPDALVRLAELDSMLQSGPMFGAFEAIGNIEVARLWHAHGQPVRALASIRRRPRGFFRVQLPRYLRDEGRYSALVGDREGAIKAYQHYLRLRSEAEPALQPEVASVRGELKALEEERPDR